MIIIPSKRLVLITPPRTGSTSLKILAEKHCLDAMFPYRHMEADGIPFGYDRFRRVGIFRPPVERMWSLYNFCKELPKTARGTPLWRDEMARSVEFGFEEWILNNRIRFTDPVDPDCENGYLPKYAVKHLLPENQKSLYHYLRPDLGVEIMTLKQAMTKFFGEEQHVNRTESEEPPVWNTLSKSVRKHFEWYFGWDFVANYHIKSGSKVPSKWFTL